MQKMGVKQKMIKEMGNVENRFATIAGLIESGAYDIAFTESCKLLPVNSG